MKSKHLTHCIQIKGPIETQRLDNVSAPLLRPYELRCSIFEDAEPLADTLDLRSFAASPDLHGSQPAKPTDTVVDPCLVGKAPLYFAPKESITEPLELGVVEVVRRGSGFVRPASRQRRLAHRAARQEQIRCLLWQRAGKRDAAAVSGV